MGEDEPQLSSSNVDSEDTERQPLSLDSLINLGYS